MSIKLLYSRNLALLGLLLALSVVLVLAPAAGAAAKKPAPTPWTGPVPKADCGPNDRMESGLQGQTTVAERESGDSELGYNCNLELVGQLQGEGAKSWMMDWFNDCAYVPTNNHPEQEHPGVVVVDASDPRQPQATAYLDTPAMLDPHESLKVHERRKLLAAAELTSFTTPRPPEMGFDVYDLSGDCSRPALKASVDIPGAMGHAGNFAPDGLTYYVAHTLELGLSPIDISDPSEPQPLGVIDELVHDLSFSKDGTRAYLTHIGNFPPVYPVLTGPNGLTILDVSDFQLRRPNPQTRVISQLFWDDGGGAQQTLPVTYRGRQYLIFTDEGGSVAGGATASCDRGLPPNGFARIIDISDERNPKVVSKLMLEVNDPANCASLVDDPSGGGGYSSHYCGVDKAANPKLLACGYREAGLRVFDIRDPFNPREIAYYKPPARRTAFLPGSNRWAPGADRTTDKTASQIRITRHKGEVHLWFASSDNGFQIVRFTKPLNELLVKGASKGRR